VCYVLRDLGLHDINGVYAFAIYLCIAGMTHCTTSEESVSVAHNIFATPMTIVEQASTAQDVTGIRVKLQSHGVNLLHLGSIQLDSIALHLHPFLLAMYSAAEGGVAQNMLYLPPVG